MSKSGNMSGGDNMKKRVLCMQSLCIIDLRGNMSGGENMKKRVLCME